MGHADLVQASRRVRRAIEGLLATSAVAMCMPAHAQTSDHYEANILPTSSLYGGVGLLDMRNARFMPDGYLDLNVVVKYPDNRFALTFQATPWLEATFRYAVNYALAPAGQRALYDRSFDTKIRLLQEDEYIPQVAVGLQDFIGTGVYSAEYLVASKRFGPVDVTMGMGWGRLASRGTISNPLCSLATVFCTRPNTGVTTGGAPLFSNFFRGPDAGLFGGFEYNTPIPNLTFKIEYSSDGYHEESSYRGEFGKVVHNINYAPVPVNTGFSYRFFHNVDLGLALIGGREISLDVSIAMNPSEPNWPDRIDPQPPFAARPAGSGGPLTQLDLNNDGSERTRVHFIDLKSLRDMLNRPPDPAFFHGNELRIASVFQRAGLPLTDGWIVGDTLVAQIKSASASASTCEKLAAQSGLPAPQVILVGQDWNPLVTCAAATGSAPPEPVAQAANHEWPDNALSRMRDAVSQQQIIVQGISIEHGVVKVEIENQRYFRDAEAISRTLRALSATAPADIGAFEVTTSIAHMPLSTVVVPRTQIDGLARFESTPAELWKSTILSDAQPDLDYQVKEGDPQFSWSIFPAFEDDLFDPNNPVYVGFGISGATHTEIFPGLVIDNTLTYNIWNNFQSISRTSNSVLPRVRSDVASYLRDTTLGISDLTASYFFKPTPELYARLAAGYIEPMFGGAGGEVLYRPFGQRWAVGADIYDVYQRNFDDLFGFQTSYLLNERLVHSPYQVVTGHVSLYVETPWYGITTVVRAGRYLAGDYGATLELYRRFDTGIIVGAWATFTNVPFSQFGEGSFDKGIKIIIPTEWALPFGTPSKYELDLRPLQRDGGQPLANDAELYDMTQPSSYGDLERQWPHVFE